MKSVKYKLENFHHVYQISVVNQLNLIIVISGEERELWMFDLKELEEKMENGRFDEPLKQRPVLNLTGCHLFSTSEDFVCAATEKTVYLMKWNYQMEFFQKLEVLCITIIISNSNYRNQIRLYNKCFDFDEI
ncbi:uncharacterized protein LOC111618101 [Centruroides sculpturatus]|uniref:uncharacterized protein LOC111618101 n=1 Tax=Centruroides sculpturatus TaxID=218467 RepID=UPI000C6DCBA4|nr:uncharacterized protein LOC111618101 [Centruroides sculpturatus]